jgi:hypothetical protein
MCRAVSTRAIHHLRTRRKRLVAGYASPCRIPEVEGAIVITDGAMAYPNSAVPYQVLWILTCDADNFRPDYGQVIGIEPNK